MGKFNCFMGTEVKNCVPSSRVESKKTGPLSLI